MIVRCADSKEYKNIRLQTCSQAPTQVIMEVIYTAKPSKQWAYASNSASSYWCGKWNKHIAIGRFQHLDTTRHAPAAL